MPNRIIKESICSSENIDQLTAFQEVFFYRLMVNCDDFGRYDARPKLLSSRLFPLREVPVETVTETLSALRDADLIVVYEVGGHPYLQMKTWGKHQQGRAVKSKYPSFAESVLQTDDINCNQMQSIDINCNQDQADDSKCPRNRIRNRIRNTVIDNRNRDTREDADADGQMITDGDARLLQQDHDRVLNAAEDAGFRISNSVRAALVRLYAENGLDKVLEGISSCVKHGAPNLAYLEACMKDEPKKPKQKKVTAQEYEQRDYQEVADEIERKQTERIMARLQETG